MKCNLWTKLSCCVLVASIWTQTSIRAQDLSFTLAEQLVIGDDIEQSSEYLFTAPELVRTDSKGNIYVHDRRREDVRVFDFGGRYLKTIGKRGEGPGEMRAIVGMHVDDSDRLIVADRLSQRFTMFSNLRIHLETKAFPTGSWAEPSNILSVGDFFVLKYVRSYDYSDGRLPYIKDTTTLHHYDSSLNWIDTFADVEDLFDFKKPFEKANSDGRGSLLMTSDGVDKVILVPEVYGGQIYVYTRELGEWSLDTLKGSPVPKRVYMSVSRKKYDANRELQRSSIVVAEPSGVYYARVYNWSLGVFILSTGETVNFTRQTPLHGELGHSAELFDRDGVLVGFGPLWFDNDRLNDSLEIMSDIEFLWVDDDNRIYLRRPNEHGFQVLSVAELVIEGL